MTYDEIKEALEAAEWSDSAEPADFPHEQTIRRKWGDRELFDCVACSIKERGYRGWFFGSGKSRLCVFVDVGQYQYWAETDPIYRNTVINRAPLGSRLSNPLR